MTNASPLSDEMSFRLSFIKFFSIIAVIYIHSCLPDIQRADYPLTDFIVTLIRENFVRFAVPVFYAVSGFLYFSREYPDSYGGFVRKKAKAVLWPYFLWNTLAVLYMTLLKLLPFIRTHAQNSVFDWTPLQWVQAYIGFSDNWYPYLYPLWFMVYLFAVFLIAPLIRQPVIRRPALIVIPLILYVILHNVCHLHEYSFAARLAHALFFFCFGYFLKRFQPALDRGAVCFGCGFAYILLNVLRTVLPELLSPLPRMTDLILGTVFVFTLSKYALRCSPPVKNFLASLFPLYFLLYASHELLLMYSRQ